MQYSFKNEEHVFASEDEINAKTHEIDFGNLKTDMSGIPIISDGKSGRLWSPEQPMLIVSDTGSGKTTTIIQPYVYSCIAAGESFVLSDMKDEDYDKFYNVLKAKKYNIIRLDFRDPRKGNKFNPLTYYAKLYAAGEVDKAREGFSSVAEQIFADVHSEKDAFWENVCKAKFAGLCALACEISEPENLTIRTVFDLHQQGDMNLDRESYLRRYFSSKERRESVTFTQIDPSLVEAKETRTCIGSVFTTALSKYIQNEGIIDMCTNSDFNPEDLITKKTAVFIVGRSETSIYDNLISLMVDEIFRILIDKAHEKYNKMLPRRVNFVLDEFGNLPQINDIERKLTICRSYNISFCFAIQSLQQLNYRYGKDLAKIIIGNCSIAYMYTSDIELLEMISALSGDYEYEFGKSKRLFSVNKLRYFDKDQGQVLFLLNRLKPFISYLPGFYNYDVNLHEEHIEIMYREKQERKRINLVEFVTEEERTKKQKIMMSGGTHKSKEVLLKKQHEDEEKINSVMVNIEIISDAFASA